MISKGFTLIELMIVVAIIGILTAIAIPAISGKPTKDYECVGGYKFTYSGQQIFSSEKEGIPCYENR